MSFNEEKTAGAAATGAVAAAAIPAQATNNKTINNDNDDGERGNSNSHRNYVRAHLHIRTVDLLCLSNRTLRNP